MRIYVEGTPVPMPRPRATSFGGKARVYQPKGKATEWKATIMRAFKGCIPITEGRPVELELNFYLPRPKSHYKTGKFSHILRDDAPIFHLNKSDVDNLAKAVMDSMTDACVWHDDGCVDHLTVSKKWAEDGNGIDCRKPGVQINIEF